MKSRLSHLCALVMLALAFASSAKAGLLGVEPARPLAAFNSTGVLTYDADTRRLHADATVLAIRFNGIDILIPLGSGTLQLNVVLRTSGSYYRGVNGHDFVLRGTVDVNDDGIPEYTGDLLTAEVSAVGFQEGGATDVFDFRLNTTGGSMAGVFGQKIAIVLTSENSTFNNNFCVDFGGGAKGDVGTINGDDCPHNPDWWRCHTCDWPVCELTIGGREYNNCELYNLLNGRLPNGGYAGNNAAARLARYLVAVKFSLLDGAGDPGGLVAIISHADAFLAAHPPGSNLTSAQIAEANELKDGLYDFVNNREWRCGCW